MESIETDRDEVDGKTVCFSTGVPRPGRGMSRTRAGIWPLLCWAFQRERASIDFEDSLDDAAPSNVGMEYVLMERARLGVGRLDGGGSSPCHPDADIVAAALAVLPEVYGGRRMALWIAGLARAGQVPDWMAGARPRVEPAEWGWNRHGRHAKTAACGTVEVVVRGRLRAVELRCCPVVYRVTPDEIARARRGYAAWWRALLALQLTMRDGAGLSAFEVTGEMPPAAPWKEKY